MKNMAEIMYPTPSRIDKKNLLEPAKKFFVKREIIPIGLKALKVLYSNYCNTSQLVIIYIN
jgi:hypothetical protein